VVHEAIEFINPPTPYHHGVLAKVSEMVKNSTQGLMVFLL